MNRIIHLPVIRIIIGIIICLVVPIVIKALVVTPVISLLSLDENMSKSIEGVFSILIILLTYHYLFKYYEKRKITELAWKYFAKEIGIGFFIGVILISLVILILFVMGYYTIFSSNYIFALFPPFIFLALMSVFEETIFRGIIYRIIEEKYGTIVALIISAVLFGLIHVINSDSNVVYILSATAGGLLLGVLYTLTGRLWLPISFHLGWNFGQYLYGVNRFNEGFSFVLESKLVGPMILTGGENGIENSVLSIIFVLILFLFCAFLINKRKVYKSVSYS